MTSFFRPLQFGEIRFSGKPFELAIVDTHSMGTFNAVPRDTAPVKFAFCMSGELLQRKHVDTSNQNKFPVQITP